MAIIYTYSSVTPEPTDLLVITDVSDNNYTKSSTITAAIAATIAAGQNIWFTTSGAGVITINSAVVLLKTRYLAYIPYVLKQKSKYVYSVHDEPMLLDFQNVPRVYGVFDPNPSS